MGWVHRVKFGANISLPIPFDIATGYNFSLLAVFGAEMLAVVGNVDIVFFEESPVVENWDDRGLKLGARVSRHSLSWWKCRDVWRR